MHTKDVDILRKAILLEAEGEQFYRMAADKTDHHDVKNAFLFLAAEEKQHGEWLLRLMDSLAPDQEYDIKAWEQDSSLTLPPIFDRDKIKGADRNTLEISVFHTGILMEKASVDYYREAATQTASPEAKALYEKLSHWEMHHLEELEKTYDFLTENWFDHQSFSPA